MGATSIPNLKVLAQTFLELWRGGAIFEIPEKAQSE